MVLSMIPRKYSNFIYNTEEPIAFVLARYMTLDLGVIRSLKKKNIPTFVLSIKKNPTCSYSKYYKGMICPNPKDDEKKYVDFLLDLGEKLKNKGVLFPVGDIELSVITKNKNKLEKYYHYFSDDYEKVEKFLNKRFFFETIEKYDIPRPKTYPINDKSDVEIISKKIDYPCIIKPIYSDYFRHDFKMKLFIAKSEKELIKNYKITAAKGHEVVVQEIIPGSVRNHYGFDAFYDKKSQPNGCFMYRRIREWPHSFGNGCMIESVIEPELEEITNKLVKKIGYHGIVDAEFKKDSKDYKFKIIEINSRCWMQNGFPTCCGINFPYMAYMDAIGKKFEKQIFNGKHVKWLYMPEDIVSSIKYLKNKQLTIKDLLKSFKGKKEYAIFSWDDPLPFFALFNDLPLFYRRKQFYKESNNM